MNISSISKTLVLSVSIFAAGCATTQNNESAPQQAQTASQFEQFINERPETEALAIGDVGTDLTLSAIAGTYVKTVEMTDAFIAKTEAAPAFETLLKLREEQGDEAYEKALTEMSEQDQKAYQDYLDSNEELTKQAIALIPEALKLQKGMKEIDPKSIVSNPLKLGGAVKSLDRAGEQMLFTTDALAMMKKYHDIYSNAKQYAGR